MTSSEIEALMHRVKELENTVQIHQISLAAKDVLIEQLKEALKIALARKYGRSAESYVDPNQIDLFDEGALKRFKKLSSFTQFDSVLIDPPRKGFPELNNWIKSCKPKQLVYVSCNAATMARDLQKLEGKFTIDKIILVDLFPSTYHFETVACLSFK